jgi:PAS domain S-box-containing protein
MMGALPLRILFVEDVAADAELAAAELRRAGVSFEWRRVETRGQFVAALGEYRPALVLSDFTLSGFNGMDALALTLEHAPETPFILVTGSTNEETAVACIRAGAWDYILKDRLSRLPLAVRAALDRAHVRARERQAQEALRESEARFHLLAEFAPVGIFRTNERGETTYVNRRWTQISGMSADEALGQGWLQAVHPGDRGPIVASWDDAARAGRTSDAEYRFLRPDGTVAWVVGHAVALLDTAGRVTGYVGTVYDITERRRAEEALRESEERYRLVLANSLDAHLLTNPGGAIHSANAAACAMFGRSEAEICRLGRAGVIDEADPRLAAALAERLEKGRFRGELTGLRADGTKFPIEVSSSLFRDASGALHTSMAIRDITQQAALEAQLRQAQKMEAIGSLAGGVAHDFNNVLQAMLSHVQLLSAVGSDPARVAAAAAELEQQIRRGATLTRQLLLFSRRETTKPEALDLNEIVRTSAQLLRRLVRENISFRLVLAEDALPVRADRGQLDQVLMNLVVNAADAMPDGGVLRVGTGRSADGLPWVSVSDTGRGIPEAIRDRVFEPFFTTKAPGKGTGIGLSVVRAIVEQHGGAIQLESGVGRGTTFRITFPASDAAAAASDGPSSGDKPLPRGRGERVLIVEDEQGAREGIAEILTSLGYTVFAAASGEDAQALPAEPPFDLLLTDLMLPGMAGPELAVEMVGRWPRLRVILMSGYTEDEAVKRRIAAELVRFLQKPFDMARLAHEVRAALDERTDGR